MYNVRSATLLAGTTDLIQIEPAVNKPAIIHLITIDQVSDYGDAEAEALTLVMRNRITNGIISGDTPVAMHKSDAAFSGKVNIFGSPLTAGAVIVGRFSWNIQSTFVYAPEPLERPYIVGTDMFSVNISAPADEISIRVSALFEELG